MNKDLTIYSVYHKEFAVPHCDYIQPIQVGKTFSKLELGFISDDIGENIAVKNKTFSELTALFWIWKNIEKVDSEFVGLCHYRRYFTLPEVRIKKKLFNTKIIVDPRDVYYAPFSEEALKTASNESLKDALLNQLHSGKVVVPTAAHLALELSGEVSIKMHYIFYHIREDWYLMKNAVVKLYPDMEKAFNEFFDTEKKMHCYNMFIARKEVLIDYCNWLFPILFELEKTVKLSEYEYQRRIFGFFSERLFNLYLFYNNLQKAEFPVVFFS